MEIVAEIIKCSSGAYSFIHQGPNCGLQNNKRVVKRD